MAEIDVEARSSDLAARFDDVRRYTEHLASPLSPEDQMVQSMPDVSPTKWHRGHTTWFFETFILAQQDPYSVFHPAFGYIFNSYYEAVGSRQPRDRRGVISRPGTGEVADYRDHVDKAMAEVLTTTPSERTLELTELGINHEQQHQELLLMDIKHVLSCNPLQPSYRAADDRPRPVPAPEEWLESPGVTTSIGHGLEGFGFDNEFPRHDALLTPFALCDRLVSCGDWTAFIDDGGYRRPELWLSDGWATATALGWDSPLYWRRDAQSWQVFTLCGPQPLDPSQPVCHVSYYEADAFARWQDARLPTEAEWEVVASATSPRAPGPHLHPRSAENPMDDLFGEVWQWTQSAYGPYPGFRPAPGAVGEYNGKFMVNQQVLRGSACITPPGHSRATYRNFFHPGSRWAFSGLRLAKDI